MVKQSFHPDDLQKAFIPFGPIMGLAAVLGPILAGVLLDADLFGTGWRMIFLINVPVGVVGTFLAWRYLPDVPKDPSARLDVRGALLLTAASALLIFPLVQGREDDWPAWSFVMMAASGAGVRGLRGQRAAQRPPGHRALVVRPSRLRRGPGVPGLVLRRDERPDAGRQPVHPARPRLRAVAHRADHDAAGPRPRPRRGRCPAPCSARGSAGTSFTAGWW